MRNLIYICVIYIIVPCYACAKTSIYTIMIENHKFSPEVLEVPAGKKFKLLIINQDNSAEEFESFDLKREKIVPSNSKIRISLPPLKPGEYKFFGEFNPKTAQGKIVAKKDEGNK